MFEGTINSIVKKQILILGTDLFRCSFCAIFDFYEPNG